VYERRTCAVSPARAASSSLRIPARPSSRRSAETSRRTLEARAFKYGVTGAWVTGLEAVLPPGDLVRVGGAIRKDVAGYDLKNLLIGSEGTLVVVTAVWLKLIPAPEASLPVVGFFRDIDSGIRLSDRSPGQRKVKVHCYIERPRWRTPRRSSTFSTRGKRTPMQAWELAAALSEGRILAYVLKQVAFIGEMELPCKSEGFGSKD
jgi:FAD/FMN-containing dehydrogenase